MLTVVTQEYSMSIPLGIPHTDMAFQTARIYIWVCMILIQKNVEVLAAKSFFWLLIRGSVDYMLLF